MSAAIYWFDTATVRFAIYPEGAQGARVIAEIGENPLRDVFGARGGGDSLVTAYQAHSEMIDARAIERHRTAPGKPVRLEIDDFVTSDWAALAA